MTAIARRLAQLLVQPDIASTVPESDWTALLSVARAERLDGTLAARVLASETSIPGRLRAIFADIGRDIDYEHVRARWEIDRAELALRDVGCPVILLKGSAFLAADLNAALGRRIGDLDILISRQALDDAEAALLAAGWEWVKPDPYDDDYYRRWMHELPPLIHRERDRMIDVHHTILPLTAKPNPLPELMIASRDEVPGGVFVLRPEDMVCHAAAHLIADGDLTGGMRNLWDIHCLCEEFARRDQEFYTELYERGYEHDLLEPLMRALRLSASVFGTPVATDVSPLESRLASHWSDVAFENRLFARDGWGRQTKWALRQFFYVRSHVLRMPLLMLLKHLWTKWRMGHDPG